MRQSVTDLKSDMEQQQLEQTHLLFFWVISSHIYKSSRFVQVNKNVITIVSTRCAGRCIVLVGSNTKTGTSDNTGAVFLV